MSFPIEALLADEELRRVEYPIARSRSYFAHAAVGPFPRCVVAAIQSYLARAAVEGPFEHLHAAAEQSARRLAAQLIGASPSEIAITTSTSAGLGTVAMGLDWQPGDRVLIREGDFPANVYPWRALERRGVSVDAIPWQSSGAVSVADVESRLTGRTRLVSLSSVDYFSGTAIPVRAIGDMLQRRGVLFCVDAIQSLGAVPCSVEGVDFLAADAHKWLLGPQGAGILYVRTTQHSRLTPAALGWKSVARPREFFDVDQPLADGARRFEPGSLNALGLVGLNAALERVANLGLPAIQSRIRALRNRLVRALEGLGHSPLGMESDGDVSGIVSFAPANARELHRELDARGIVTSLRMDRSGTPVIRLAPHYYTTEAEVEGLLIAIGRPLGAALRV